MRKIVALSLLAIMVLSTFIACSIQPVAATSTSSFGLSTGDTEGVSYYTIILGSNYTLSGWPTQVANSVSVMFWCMQAETENTTCAIYNYSAGPPYPLIAQTQSKLITFVFNGSTVWVTFPFASPPTLYNGITYLLCLWSNGSGGNNARIDGNIAGGPQLFNQSATPYTGTFPSTLSPNLWNYPAFSNLGLEIYCNFTQTSGSGEPAPSCTGYSQTFTIAGGDSTFTTTWSSAAGLSGYIFSTNNSGVWQNATWVPFSGSTTSNLITLNGTVGVNVTWIVYANDSLAQWSSFSQSFLTTAYNPPSGGGGGRVLPPGLKLSNSTKNQQLGGNPTGGSSSNNGSNGGGGNPIVNAFNNLPPPQKAAVVIISTASIAFVAILLFIIGGRTLQKGARRKPKSRAKGRRK